MGIFRLRLSTLLVLINVSLTLMAVVGVSGAAVQLLRQLADEQALGRVAQAAQSARQELDATRDTLLTTTRLLAERPTLQRLLQTDQSAELSAFLERFRQTGGLGGCAVLREGRVVMQSGVALDWSALPARLPHTDTPGAAIASDGGAPVLVAYAPVQALTGTLVLTARPLDAALAQEIGARVGLPVTIRPAPGLATPPDPRAALWARAAEAPAVGRIDPIGSYLAVVALPQADQAAPALLEISLPTTAVDESMRRLVQDLLLLALSVTVLAALVNLLVGRRLGAPLLQLSDAASGIGRGDLATPIKPPAQGAEITALAGALEEMRGQLLQLTGDLRQHQAEAEAILTGIVEGVFTVDRERRVRYINPQAAELLGIAPEQAIGRFCGDVLNPRPDNTGVRPCEQDCPILQARFRGNARATEHLTLPDGQSRTVIITSAATSEGQQVQVLRDETELEATRRLRDAVLANISHEFRTPLSAQLASIEILLDRLPDLTIHELGQLVLSLQRGTLRLTRLIDNLLESVRIESGQDSIRLRPVSLDEVVEEAVELTRPLLNQRGQDVAIDLPYPLPSVKGDARRLTQVFVNLLANANKFAPLNSLITIGGVVQEDSIALWVEDRGPGLPPMAGQSLFERFVRAPAEEPEQNGMGLGLWIVKSIVERHGGQVGAQSSPAGTQMYVILPRGREQADEDPRC